MRSPAIVTLPIATANGEADGVGGGRYRIAGNTATPLRIGSAASSARNTFAADEVPAGDTRATRHRR
jgi:hypothetical protein